MANIFRSKEIYKKIKTNTSEQDIVSIRGMYVVGDYSPPYYIQPMMVLTNVETNKAKIADYVDQREIINPGDSCHGLLDIDIIGDLTIARYTKEYAPTIQSDNSCHGLLDLDLIGELSVYKYGKDYPPNTYPNDSLHGLLDLDIEGHVEFIKYENRLNPQKNPCIRITRCQTTKALITNQNK